MRFVLESWTVLKYAATRPPRNIKTIKAGTSVGDALRLLASNNISSAPILDERGEVVGFFSAAVAAEMMLKAHLPSLVGPLWTADAMRKALKGVDLSEVAKNFGKESPTLAQPVALDSTHASDGDITWKGFTSTSLLDLVSHGLKGPVGSSGDAPLGDFAPSHRIAVYEDAEGGGVKIVDVVSQSDALSALLRDPDRMGTTPRLRLLSEIFSSAGAIPSPLVSVPPDLPAVAAFALMLNNRLSGLPVLSADGKLLAEVDVRMLEHLWTAEGGGDLSQGVQAFCLAHGAAAAKAEAEKSGGRRSERLCRAPIVHPGDTLLQLMTKLHEEHARRAYVVDALSRVVGVLTLSDILQLIAVDPATDKEQWLTW